MKFMKLRSLYKFMRMWYINNGVHEIAYIVFKRMWYMRNGVKSVLKGLLYGKVYSNIITATNLIYLLHNGSR